MENVSEINETFNKVSTTSVSKVDKYLTFRLIDKVLGDVDISKKDEPEMELEDAL